jgi:hypothetical protein
MTFFRTSLSTAAAAVAILILSGIPATAQTPLNGAAQAPQGRGGRGSPPAPKPGPVPRMPDGKPDMTGYWSLGALRFNGNLASDGEDKVPYTPAGKAAYLNHDAKNDPTGFCMAPGMPRMLHSPFPMKVMQDSKNVTFLYEYMRIWRLVDVDRKEHYSDVSDTFMGDSIGHWEGDTFVVETTGINDRSWLDTAGHQHTNDIKVIERMTRTGPESMDYEVQVIDPKYYAKPWIHKGVLTPQRPTKGLPELLEYFCVDNNIDVGHLVSTKPDQH